MDDLRGLCAPCKVALERLGLPASEAYVGTLLRQYDRDQDGSVTYDDFASYVQKNEAKIWQAFRCAFQHMVRGPATAALLPCMTRLAKAEKDRICGDCRLTAFLSSVQFYCARTRVHALAAEWAQLCRPLRAAAGPKPGNRHHASCMSGAKRTCAELYCRLT